MKTYYITPRSAAKLMRLVHEKGQFIEANTHTFKDGTIEHCTSWKTSKGTWDFWYNADSPRIMTIIHTKVWPRNKLIYFKVDHSGSVKP